MFAARAASVANCLCLRKLAKRTPGRQRRQSQEDVQAAHGEGMDAEELEPSRLKHRVERHDEIGASLNAGENPSHEAGQGQICKDDL